jgi:hypothetical protein
VSETIRYHVTAAPERVLAAIARAVSPGGLIGFSLTDRAATGLIGSVAHDATFSLRRPRGLITPPRVLVLRGRVESAPAGANVLMTFSLHPAVRAARAVWVLFFVVASLLVLPAAQTYPELLWAPVVLGLVVLLMLVPFELLARQDKTHLGSEVEDLLRRAGAIKAFGGAN